MKVKDILKLINGKIICGDENEELEKFSKDTRTIEKGDTYIGIKGENFDGNLFYKQAIEKGAKICILQDTDVEKIDGTTMIIVEDTIRALQEIAKYKRSLYNIPVIAITGSVGKTSTKDIVANVVAQKYKVLKTQGNLNNQIGVPLTILNLDDHAAMVIEMGMNQLNEISRLSEIANPNIAVITNVGTAHIGNLGSRENILKAKLEIIDGLKENGKLIINNDNDLLNEWNKNDGENSITYGIEKISKYMAEDIKLLENNSIFKYENTIIEVPIGGKHFVYNALCAIAVGKELGIDMSDIKRGIQEFQLTKKRMDIVKTKYGEVIKDYYNANYESMKSAIDYLSNKQGKVKVAILGDMLELGEFSEELHRKVGEEVYKNKIDILITVGKLSEKIFEKVKELNENKEVVKIHRCNVNEEVIHILDKYKDEKNVILLKASNGMKFDYIFEKINI